MSDAPLPAGDLAALDLLLEYGGERLVRGMLALFVQHTPERVAQARAALAAGDVDTLSRAAHTVKSSAAQIGAPALRALAARLEHEAAEGAPAAALAALVAALDTEYEAWHRWAAASRYAPLLAP